jgi:hypothetical protein
MPFSALAPLFRLDDTTWYSLQVGDREADATDCRSIYRPDPPLNTFADTAAVIAQLDYVVTVDTAVAHLAGSLGVPTYLLLPTAATWRWGLANDTAWYPTMRLIRQQKPGDWTGAIHELLERLKGDDGRLSSPPSYRNCR